MDYAQVENYFPDPATHARDAQIRDGMFFEPVANSPPAYLLQGLGGDPKNGAAIAGGAFGEPAPPQVESTLSWLGAMNFAAANVVNFCFEPNSTYVQGFAKTNKTISLRRPDHVAAQAAYARRATKLLPALLPDVADPVSGRRLDVRVASASTCAAPAAIAATASRAAYDFATEDAVAAAGLRAPWAASFCAFVLVANLCGAPTTYALAFDADDVPGDVTDAVHAFDATYNVTVDGVTETPDGRFVRRTWDDVVGPYETTVLRLGCDGWSDL